MGIHGGSAVKNLPTGAGDASSIPESGRFPGEGNGSPLQYSCLENPMDIGTWRAIVCELTESDMTERLNHHDHVLSLGWMRMCRDGVNGQWSVWYLRPLPMLKLIIEDCNSDLNGASRAKVDRGWVTGGDGEKGGML